MEATTQKQTIEQFLADAENWECPVCHERINCMDGNARWNGRAWEHRCKDMDAQVGYNEAVRIVK